MKTNSILRFFQGVFIATLLGVVPARAQSGALHDNAGFFSDQARTDASRNIAEIGKRFKKDLVIETFKEIPADVKKDVNLEDKTALNKMFEQWALKQARQLKVNGVYVLLSKEPSHLQVAVGNDTQSRAFTLRDRDTLVDVMLSRLRKKENDQALLEGVNYVSTTMAGHASSANRSVAAPAQNVSAPARVSSHSASPWGWIIVAVIGFIAMVVILGIIRAIFRGSSGYGGVAPGVGGGGGGFFSSLLGGVFGAATGMWLYDQFTGRNQSMDSGSDVSSRRNDDGFYGQDSDYSSSGGDFGDSGGGGDSGGDSGGGDSGGGGGDF